MKRIAWIALALVAAGTLSVVAAEDEAGFKPLMDGKTFEGWKKANESPDTWKIVDGAFVANGKRCNLF